MLSGKWRKQRRHSGPQSLPVYRGERPRSGMCKSRVGHTRAEGPWLREALADGSVLPQHAASADTPV